MTGVNTGEGNNENSETQKAQKQDISKLHSAQRDFIGSQLEQNIEYSLPNDIAGSFLGYINSNSLYKDLANDIIGYSDEQKTNLEKQIRVEFVKEKSILTQNQKRSLDILSREYEFSADEESKSKQAISKLSRPDLKKMICSESFRNQFISQKKIFGEQDIKMRDIGDYFEQIAVNLDYSTLNQTQIDALDKFMSNKNSLARGEINTVFSVFSKPDQIKLLREMAPSFSLEQLIDYKVINKDQARQIIESTVNEVAQASAVDPSDISYSTDDFSDIYVNTDDFSDDDLSQVLLSPRTLSQIEEEINQQKSQIRKDMYHDFDGEVIPEGPNEDIHKNFIEFIAGPKNQGKISQKVRESIRNLESGGYIKLSKSGKEDTGKPDGYYKVVATDVGTSFDTKTLTLKNIGVEGGVRKESEVSEEMLTYKNLYDLFISDNAQKDTGVEILSAESFQRLGNNEIICGEVEGLGELKSKLDEIDPEGADIPLEAGTFSIHDRSSNPPQSYQITAIDDSGITLSSSGKREEMQLNEFAYTFEQKKGKISRKKNITDFGSLETALGDSLSGVTLHEKKDKLVLEQAKNKSGDEAQEIQYFIGDSGDAIRIDNISDTSVEYTLGKITEGEGKDKKDKKFKAEYKSSGLNDFYLDIDHYKMSPDKNHAYAHMKNEAEQAQMKSGGFGKWLQCLSITDMLTGGKQIIDGFKHSFEQGDKLKAAKFADAVAKRLPIGSNMRLELKMHKEKIEKETIQEMIDSMKGMGSMDLIKKVRGIITNNGSQEYEVIACMFTVAEKYGDLYPKGLADLEKTQIWFKRLGGNRYPDIIPKVRKAVDNPDKSTSGKQEPINFTEDELIFELLTKRAKDGTLRSKINKDYRKALNIGVEDEMKDGEEKVAEQFTTQGKIDHVVGELANRGFANALGGMEKLFKKYSDPVGMQACPFIFTFAGSGQELLGPLMSKTLGLTMSTPYASLGFALSKENTKLYQDAIIRAFDKKGNTDASGELKKILGMPWKTDKTSRADELSKFWSKYGKETVDLINFNDPYMFLHKEEEPLFAKFYDVMNGYLGNDEHQVDKDELEAGVYNSNPTVFAGSKDGVGKSQGGGLELVEGDQGYGFGRQGGQKVTEMYFEYLHKIKDSESLSDTEKKKVFMEVFPNIENALRLGLRGDANEAFEKYPGAPLPGAVLKNRLDLFRGNSMLAEKGKAEYDDFLERTWQKFMGASSGAGTTTHATATTIGDILTPES